MSLTVFRLASLSVLAGAPALSLMAQTSPDTASSTSPVFASLDPVVVSASRVPQTLSDVIPAVSVIRREDIERSQAPTLVDLLSGEAGVEIGRNGGPGSVASIFLRGQNSVSVAIFIDGVRAQVDQIGSIRMVDLPVNMIERVEIVRGNVGALYGESAIGGVINVITRPAEGPPTVSASVMTGSRQTRDVSVGYRGKSDGLGFSLSAQRYSSDGFSAMDPRKNPAVNPDADGFERNALHLRLERDISTDAAIGVSMTGIRSETQFDSGFGAFGDKPTDQHLFITESSDITLFGRFRPMAGWSSRLSGTSSDIRYRDLRNGNELSIFSGGRIEGQQESLRWDNTVAAGGGNAIFGAESSNGRFDAYGSRHRREADAVFAGYSTRIERLDLQANLRRDEIAGRSGTRSVSSQATTWLTGAGFMLSEAWRITASVSTAFRAPATGELYGWGGNPNLDPESHRSTEAGVSYKTGAGLTRLVRFDTRTRNAIVYVSNTYSNVGRVENDGMELTYSGALGSTRIRLSAVTQDPRNAVTGQRLARRAQRYGAIEVVQPWAGSEFSARVLASGNRIDAGQELPAYNVVNLGVSRMIRPGWTARLRVENAFNAEYQLVAGYRTPPRGVFLALDYQPRN